jgi:hypothetical protein
MRLAAAALSVPLSRTERWRRAHCRGNDGLDQARWLGAVLLLLLAGLLLALYWQQVLPRTQGTMVLPGLQGELRIERDTHGIATIRAASARDAYFGLGVVHAQTDCGSWKRTVA